MAKKRMLPIIDRRDFMKFSSGCGAAAAAFSMFPGEFATAQDLAKNGVGAGARRTLQAACPYCGVGCGCLISCEGDRITGIIPDKLHPTNKGVQCIKGLNAHEPVYRDRLTHVLVRKDMSDPITGYVSKTKGRFDEDCFKKVSYEEAEELVAEKTTALAKKFGGNSIGLSGSGQLTMETQWIENLLMKGILASNSIEANARMCMTSAVTG
ncbi:MAG: twin-arginine translocation signal domain-containing protein, partial [Planctomycetota bacterium]|nr:twin-arginine translocation signal domain-containing protein [Planctomycetota bacterium]